MRSVSERVIALVWRLSDGFVTAKNAEKDEVEVWKVMPSDIRTHELLV
jgi:hypothetical protein